MRYTIEINYERLKPLKLLLLALCLVIDFGNLWIMIAGIATRNVWQIVKSLGIFAFLIAVRIIACTLTHKWLYKFDAEKVVVNKVVLGRQRQKVAIEYCKIDSIEKVDRESQKPRKSPDDVILAPKNCKYDIYAITYENKRYFIALDEYGYCIIKGKTYDIS